MKIVNDDEVINAIPQYDANKKYKWSPEETFMISGNEFGLLLNTIRTIISTPDAQRIILAQKASESLEQIMQLGVESGQIIELED